MNVPRFRIRTVVLALILLPTTAGMVAVEASATCQRFVHTYVTLPVHQRVSKATAIAWAQWREAHPNWKPKPNARRIGTPMTREESIKKVDFSCDALDPTPANTDDLVALIPPVEPPLVDGSPEPPEVAQLTTDGVIPYVPTISTPTVDTPITPPTTDVTPEPSSLLLLATGMGICGLFWRRRVESRV